MFKYTKKRSGYYRLMVDGVQQEHGYTDPLEAAEAGEVRLEAKPDAVVRVVHDYELWIEWKDKPAVVSDWSAVVNVTVGPRDPVVLNSASTVTLKIETVP